MDKNSASALNDSNSDLIKACVEVLCAQYTHINLLCQSNLSNCTSNFCFQFCLTSSKSLWTWPKNHSTIPITQIICTLFTCENRASTFLVYSIPSLLK